MVKTLTKNEKFVLDTFKDIKSGYKASDDVDTSKTHLAIKWFFDDIVNNKNIPSNSKLMKSINKHNHILTGLGTLYALKHDMEHELNLSTKIGLLSSTTIIEISKQINRLAFMSGGALHELKDSFYIYEYGEIRRATFTDLKHTMKAITDDIKD